MKTAEEWAISLHDGDGLMGTGWNHINKSQIKQIQLDAWKQGMMDAEQIVMTEELRRAGIHGTQETAMTKLIIEACETKTII